MNRLITFFVIGLCLLTSGCFGFDQEKLTEDIETNVTYASAQVGETLVQSVNSATDRIGAEVSHVTTAAASLITVELRNITRAVHENRTFINNRIIALELQMTDMNWTLDYVGQCVCGN